MSRRIAVLFAVSFAVISGAAAFVWLHAGGQSKAVVHFTPEPAPSPAPARHEENHQPIATEKIASERQPSAPPAEPGFSPVSGEVLEFSGSVAKVNNVANLRLLVNGKKQMAGKDAWHLQAFAHTQNP